MRVLPLFVALVAALACCKSPKKSPGDTERATQPNADAAWRDQFIFIGDDGTVVPLVVQRRADGEAEAKGWHGEASAWRRHFYHRFRVDPAAAASPVESITALSAAKGTPVRGWLALDGESFELELRSRSSKLVLRAPSLQLVGEITDPEGISRYRAGRGWLITGDARLDGWLAVEETPRESPRKPLVEYGDFAFVVVATPTALFLGKRSSGVAGFDHLFGRPKGGSPARFPGGRIAISGDEVTVTEDGHSLAATRVVARNSSEGTGPTGESVRYEVLLLGGAAAGVAFTIRPVDAADAEPIGDEAQGPDARPATPR